MYEIRNEIIQEIIDDCRRAKQHTQERELDDGLLFGFDLDGLFAGLCGRPYDAGAARRKRLYEAKQKRDAKIKTYTEVIKALHGLLAADAPEDDEGRECLRCHKVKHPSKFNPDANGICNVCRGLVHGKEDK